MIDPRLHAYQVRAIEHLHSGGQGLFLDMGLGKTAVVLQALTQDHLPCLVFAPQRVADEVWEVERDLWRPDLSMQVFKSAIGPTREYPNAVERRQAMLRAATADVVVVPRDLASDFGKRKHRYRTVVLDELSGYKTKGTDRWRTTRYVSTQVRDVWGLTGTPVPNGYMDLWAQVFLLDKGRRLGTTLGAYRDRYFNPLRTHRQTGQVIKWGLKVGAEDAINALLEDLCLSMKKEDYLDLPDLVFNEVKVSMPARARRAYDDLEDTLVADLRILGGSVHTAANAAVLTSKMRQVTAGFLYEDGDTSRLDRLHDEKTRALQEIVDGTGSPVIAFYQFDEGEKRNILARIEGARSIDSPNAVRDWNDGKIPVLVAHPASAGHGLNLQRGGHTQVWTSLPWPQDEWQQGVSRSHRQGQEHPVVVHVLIVPGTIDRVMYTSLKNKGNVQDALMDYLKEKELWL